MMLNRTWFARSVAGLFCALLAMPVVAAEATKATLPAQRTAIDMQRADNGSILGKLVDRQGRGLAGVDVQVSSKRLTMATLKTNNEGVFAVNSVPTGELGVRVAGQTQMVRVWEARLAPPSASSAALFVVGDTVRGQCCDDACDAVPCDAGCAPACGGCGSCNQCGLGGGGGHGFFGGHGFGNGALGNGALGNGLLARPWLLGAGVAAAIAIPVALDDDDAS